MISILIIHLEYDCFNNSKLRTNPLNYTMITWKKEVEKKKKKKNKRRKKKRKKKKEKSLP